MITCLMLQELQYDEGTVQLETMVSKQSSSATDAVPFFDDEFQILIKAFYNRYGDIAMPVFTNY